jgi:hypothetical protein
MKFNTKSLSVVTDDPRGRGALVVKRKETSTFRPKSELKRREGRKMQSKGRTRSRRRRACHGCGRGRHARWGAGLGGLGGAAEHST